jgi:hypothetical protein
VARQLSGIGLIVAGMMHQGWDVQLTAYAARDWRANFFPVGIAHSIVGGSAWEPTPWATGAEGGVGDADDGGHVMMQLSRKASLVSCCFSSYRATTRRRIST